MKKRRLTIALMLAGVLGTVQSGAQAPAAPMVPPAAEALLAAAQQQAQAERKNIFVEFGASWCPPCQRLLHFLQAPVTKPIISKYLVVLSLTVAETGDKASMNTPGGEELMRAVGGQGGIPFIAFLDANGKKLGDDLGVGFSVPENATGVAAWMDLLKRMAPGLSVGDRATLLTDLTSNSHQLGWSLSSRRVLWKMADDDWAGRGVPAVSPDQRYFAFANAWEDAIHLYDAKTNTTRPLTDGAEWIQSAAFSRDGRWLAYGCQVSGGAAPPQLCIAEIPETGTATPRRLAIKADLSGRERALAVHDWTPDGEWVVVDVEDTANNRSLALISPKDGSLRPLTRLRGGVTTAAVSRDGKYVAFDVAAPNTPRDVMVIGVGGGNATPIITHAADDALVGWTSEGEHLLFTSNRTGTRDLWSASVRDGKPGEIDLMTSDIGGGVVFGLKTSEALYALAEARGTPSEVRDGVIDFTTGSVLQAPVEHITEFAGTNGHASWSPDRRFLAYHSDRRHLGQGEVIAIRSNDTGQVREINASARGLAPLVWSPDSQSLAVAGADGIQRIDVPSGITTRVGDGLFVRLWSPDGRLFFNRHPLDMSNLRKQDIVEYNVGTGQERIAKGLVPPGRLPGSGALSSNGRLFAYLKPAASARDSDLVVLDLETGSERVLLTKLGHSASEAMSPDAQYIATLAFDPSSNADVLLVVPTNGDPARRLPSVGSPAVAPTPVVWAPDGKSFIASIARGQTPEFRGQYWWIPIDGRAPKRLDLGAEPTRVSGMNVSIDGRIVFGVAHTEPLVPAEIWQLEFSKPGRR